MSLMYEAVLRIDMGEMVNSSFHQTQHESGSLNCQRPFLLPSSSFCEVVTSEHLGQKAPK